MVIENILINIIFILIVIIISALPLYFAVDLLGGRVSIGKAFIVMVIVAILYSIITFFMPHYGAIVAFIVLIWVYREMFRLKWLKALLAWLIQMVFIIILTWILSLVGLGVFSPYSMF